MALAQLQRAHRSGVKRAHDEASLLEESLNDLFASVKSYLTHTHTQFPGFELSGKNVLGETTKYGLFSLFCMWATSEGILEALSWAALTDGMELHRPHTHIAVRMDKVTMP